MFAPKWYKPVAINQVYTLCDFRPKAPKPFCPPTKK